MAWGQRVSSRPFSCSSISASNALRINFTALSHTWGHKYQICNVSGSTGSLVQEIQLLKFCILLNSVFTRLLGNEISFLDRLQTSITLVPLNHFSSNNHQTSYLSELFQLIYFADKTEKLHFSLCHPYRQLSARSGRPYRSPNLPRQARFLPVNNSNTHHLIMVSRSCSYTEP